MEYSSFYGGRRGTPFVIKKSFASIAQMVSNFGQGYGYTEVDFDEYVIINTHNKDNPDNGKIFRRGRAYNDQTEITYIPETKVGNTDRYSLGNPESIANGGAQYIGTIVGPSGTAPDLTLSTYSAVETLHNNNQGATYVSGEYEPTDNLVPGKFGNGDNDYNDSIEWNSICIRNPDGTTSTATIGFRIPYPVIDFTVTSLNYNVSAPSIQRTDDGNHPFYEKWEIGLVKPKKPNKIDNFKISVPTQSIPSDSTNYESQNREEDIANNYTILSYEYTNYQNSSEGVTTSHYLADYNIIKQNGVTFDDYGNFKMQFTHDEDIVQKIKWVDDFQLDPDTGLFKITYNTRDDDNSPNDFDIINDGNHRVQWLKDITLSDNGVLTAQWNIKENDVNITSVVNDNPIQWFKDLSLNETGDLTATLNTYSLINDQQEDIVSNRTYDTILVNENNPIQWLENFSLSETGQLIATLNTKTNNQNDTILINGNNPIKWLENINFNYNTGYFTAIWNTQEIDENEELVNETSILNLNETPLRSIDSINLTNGYLNLAYNTDPNNFEIINSNDRIKFFTNLSLIDNGYLQGTYNTYTLIDDQQQDIELNREYETEILNDSEHRLKYFKNISLIDNGYLQATYNTYTLPQDAEDIEQNRVYDTSILNGNNRLKYITNMNLNPDNGLITVTYNTYSTSDEQQGQSGIIYDTTILNTNFPFKTITGINFEQQSGNIEVTYNLKEDQQYITQTIIGDLKLPQAFRFNTATGIIQGRYNNSQTFQPFDQNNPIEWINGILLAEDGIVTLQSNLLNTTTLNNKIKWLEDIELNNNGQITATWNTKSGTGSNLVNDTSIINENNPIKWMNSITLSKQAGTLTASYNDGTTSTIGRDLKWIDTMSFTNGLLDIKLSDYDQTTSSPTSSRLSYQMTWPVEINMSTDGTVKIKNNLQQQTTIAGEDVPEMGQDTRIKWIESVTYDDNDGLDIKFNTDQNATHLSNAFNYVKNTKIDTDHHLLLLFSDQSEISNNDPSVNSFINRRRLVSNEYWLDLGSVYEYSGILVGYYIDNSSPQPIVDQGVSYSFETTQDTITALNHFYPNGLTGDYEGKVVIVGAPGETQYFYAFNYGHDSGGIISQAYWFLLGSLAQNTGTYVGPDDGSPTTDIKISALTPDGIWFITESW